MYTIGHLPFTRAIQESQTLQSKIAFFEKESDLLEFRLSPSENAMELAEEALLSGKCDVFCLDLSGINGQPKDEIVIAALSHRDTKFDILIYKEETNNNNIHIKLNDNARVCVIDERAELLAKSLFPEWIITIIDTEIVDLERLMSLYEGIILPNEHEAIIGKNLNHFASFQFHPKEFIPNAAQNVTAYLIKRADGELRKLLSKIHVSEVSQATNIERTIQTDLSNKGWKSLAVYCVVDHNSHYHVYVSGLNPENGSFHRTRYSSSTSENIVTNVFEQLSKNV